MKNQVFLSLALVLTVPAVYADRVERVNVSSNEIQTPSTFGNSSGDSSISDDGRFVVFTSDAENLVDNDTNGATDIFLRDRELGITKRINVSANGVQAATYGGSDPRISSDGRYITFLTYAKDLVDGYNTNSYRIYRYDRTNNSLDVIAEPGTSFSNHAEMSGDGRYIVFSSNKSTFVANDTNGFTDVFVKDLILDSIERISVTSSGNQGSNISLNGSISDDGRYIAFESNAALVAADTNGNKDIYLHDRVDSSTIRISGGSGANESNDISENPIMSGDGRFIVFESEASNLVEGDTNNAQDIFVYNRVTGNTERVSITSHGSQTGLNAGHSYAPSITTDGNIIAFQSTANDLTEDTPIYGTFLYTHDRTNGVTKLVSTSSDWSEIGSGTDPHISSYGHFVTYVSSSSNLVIGDTNGKQDVFIANLLKDPKHSDFDNNNHEDLLWRNNVSGENYIYLMENTNITSSNRLDRVADQNWVASGVGDFDGDGDSDILWRNIQTGFNVLYTIQNSQLDLKLVINKVGLSWNIAGTGDFNADGKNDILWRNAIDGTVWLYTMDGNEITSSNQVQTVPLTWRIVGVGDFNCDGHADILWRNSNNGMNWLYVMKNHIVNKSVGINQIRDLRWSVEKVGDMDGNGSADILWRNSVSGDTHVYLMDSNLISSSKAIGRINNQWNIKALSDVDGDYKADIVWRNSRTGLNWLYKMDGDTVSVSKRLNTVSDLSWNIENK